jgi:hypothetical protein
MTEPPQNDRSQLEHLIHRFAASVDQAAVDDILVTVSLAGALGILADGVDASTLNQKTAAETEKVAADIKRLRCGGAMSMTLGFLTELVRRRNVSKQRSGVFTDLRKRQAMPRATQAALEWLAPDDPELVMKQLLQNAKPSHPTDREHGMAWRNEDIVAFLQAFYRSTFGKVPTIALNGEAIRFIEATMKAVGITYKRASILRAMQDAIDALPNADPNKPKRQRRKPKQKRRCKPQKRQL